MVKKLKSHYPSFEKNNGPSIVQILIPFPLYDLSLDEIGPVVLEKICKCLRCFLLCCLYLPLEKGMQLQLSKCESLSTRIIHACAKLDWNRPSSSGKGRDKNMKSLQWHCMMMKGQTTGLDKFWSAFSSGDLIVFPKFQPRDFYLNYHGIDPQYKCCSLWQCLLSSRNPWSFGLGHSDNHFSLRNYMLQDLEGNTLQI